MLQHMIEAEVLDLILGGMDLLIGVLKLRLDNECGRVSVPTSRGMIGASIATLGLDIRYITVAGDDPFDEIRQALVDVVYDDPDRLLLARIQRSLHIARHVLLQHGLDVARLLLVLRVDCLRPEQAALFGRVPVKLDCVACLAVCNGLGPQQGPQSFEDGDCTATVVIGARGSQNGGQEQVDAILVGA